MKIKKNNVVYIKSDGSIDYDKTNIEWCDRLYNCNYGTRNKRVGLHLRRKVVQLSVYGDIIKVFDSVTEASFYLGIDGSHIGSCCLGKRKTTGGYKWSYA